MNHFYTKKDFFKNIFLGKMDKWAVSCLLFSLWCPMTATTATCSWATLPGIITFTTLIFFYKHFCVTRRNFNFFCASLVF